MNREHLMLHLIRTHDLSVKRAGDMTDAELLIWHDWDHQADESHEHEREAG